MVVLNKELFDLSYIWIVLPWAITLFGLLFFIIKKKDVEDYYEDEDDEGFDDFDDGVRVAVYEDKAYWVHENIFYECELVQEPDFTTARPIDTMELQSQELHRLLKVLDDLEESKGERE